MSATTHLHLYKPAGNEFPNINEAVNDNMDILDREVYARGKEFNGTPVGEDGGFHIDRIKYAENLESDSTVKSDETFIERTSGGASSINDGPAWLMLLRGAMTHTGYVAQVINMTVTPMPRTAPPAITATLDTETFEAYVGEAGTYTITYTTEWSTSPTSYGITVSNTPVSGDKITVVWDGENDPVMTVYAVDRPVPAAITATINEATFVSYVQSGGTTTLTYSTGWNADPANYGITVTGTPIAGDVITVVYVKEERGTITQSDPQTLVSTGWNLYNHTDGYARVIKYSDTYGFKIAGTYTAVEFAATTTGERTTIVPVNGGFSIPSDGYVFVTGGNNTDTAIWMTWGDWVNGYKWDGSAQGSWEGYTTSVIDLSTYMSIRFPYGLLAVGTARDEINLNIGVALSKVERLAYTAENLAAAKASGRQYEYDENYIYLERATPVQYSTTYEYDSHTYTLDGAYTASDHGMETFTGTSQGVYAECIYGSNLKNKLERDVVVLHQGTANAGKFLIVGSDGVVVPTTVPFAQGVSF